MTSSCFHIFIQKQPPANTYGMTAQRTAVATLPSCDPHTEQVGHHQPGASGQEAPHPRGRCRFASRLVHCGCCSVSEQTPGQMKPLCYSENGSSHTSGLHHGSRFLPQTALGPEVGATYFLTHHWATLKSSLPQLQALVTVGTAGAVRLPSSPGSLASEPRAGLPVPTPSRLFWVVPDAKQPNEVSRRGRRLGRIMLIDKEAG